ncbi:MAG: adenylyltransferase/cytidyltransferase family protein [Chloroflexota bacterium]
MRDEQKRLVLTNGVFDLLHIGHVRYLEAARALGDALFVAVNSDASVRRLKGPQRPVTGELDRAEVVAALAAVDGVLIFDDTTAESIVDAIRPAIYAKGGDYSPHPTSDRFPPEGHTVTRYGGEVRILELTPGRSTTGLLGRLQDGP